MKAVNPVLASTCADISTPPASWIPNRQQFVVLLLAYFGFHLVSRTLVSEVVGIDDSYQIVAAQKLRWGYGPYPPIYTWLMMLFLRVFGFSVFSATLLRELILFCLYWLMYVNARTLTGSHVCGLVAAIGLQFNHSVSWESQRDLTNSFLCSVMVLAMLLVFFRLRDGRTGPYLVFGLCSGAAFLAKYNAALVVAALPLAAVSLPTWRSRIWQWRMALALGVCLLVISPNLVWVLTHRELASASLYKFHIQQSTPWLSTVGQGLLDGAKTTMAHLAGVLIFFGLVFWRPLFREGGLRFASDQAKLLSRTFLVLAGMMVISVVLFKVTSFKDRWLQPIFIGLPLLWVLALRESLTTARVKLVMVLGLLSAVVVAVLAPGRILLTERLNKPEILNAPFRQLAPELAPLVRQADFIVSDDRWTAANLHLWFPDKLATTPDLISFFGASGRQCLLVWDANQHKLLPDSLKPFAGEFLGHESAAAPVWLEKPWKYHHTKKFRLGAMLLNPKTEMSR